jgi:hypothetical protein
VDGPFEGTGSAITFNTGSVTASTVFNMYASSSVDSAACNKKMTSKITVHPSLDLTVTNSSPVLTANSTGAGYQWLDCDNNYAIISGENGQSFTASATGNYAVEITKNGCEKDTSACEAVTINQAPTDITLSETSIYENVAANSIVGTFSTTDPDEGDTFTYTLVEGTGDDDNAAFNISGDELRITNSPDFETQSSYSIRIRTTDPGDLSFEKIFIITVNEVIPTGTLKAMIRQSGLPTKLFRK